MQYAPPLTRRNKQYPMPPRVLENQRNKQSLPPQQSGHCESLSRCLVPHHFSKAIIHNRARQCLQKCPFNSPLIAPDLVPPAPRLPSSFLTAIVVVDPSYLPREARD